MAVGQAACRHPDGAALKKNQESLMKLLAYKKNEMALAKLTHFRGVSFVANATSLTPLQWSACPER
jgi:hypothetical protein